VAVARKISSGKYVDVDKHFDAEKSVSAAAILAQLLGRMCQPHPFVILFSDGGAMGTGMSRVPQDLGSQNQRDTARHFP